VSTDDKHPRSSAGFRDHSGAAVRAHAARRGRQTSDQHRLLEDAFDRVSLAFSKASLNETRNSYLQLRAALEAHIALEDQVFFPTLRGVEPALTSELERLSEDHARVRVELERLYDLLAEGSREAFSVEFTRFRASVEAHEKREEDVFARTVQLAQDVPESS
jgi:hypothetical protein